MIVVVEDDGASRDSLRLLLECEAFSVRDFPSCAAFLAEPAPDDIHCLILDVHMPGMNGLELLERLRTQGASVPIILMTGHSTPAIFERARAAGAFAVIEKPFRDNELINAVRLALDGSPAMTG